ncbi:potassium channel subfamily K member 18 [Leptidea sinapis]|uniref:potassium channel subfamily K member 18 n=1 Tax=Leptidea sinapis TaxID=189913 RepID=UPI0021C29CC0|nr:potassium channel subfamily K member 18 [Leptidea sinapis]
MFQALESPYEEKYHNNLTNIRQELARSIHRAIENTDSVKNSPDLLESIKKDLAAYEESFAEYLKHVNTNNKTWTFWNAMFYAGTIYTTIGYGHIAPKTTYGRVATIVYAIIGIPLFLIVLADFGKLFTRIIKFFWAFIRRFYYTRSCRRVRRTVPVQEVMKGLNIVYDVVRRPSQIFSEEDIEDAPDGSHPPKLDRKPSDVPPPLPPKPGTQVTNKSSENDIDPDTPAPSVFEIDDEFNVPISVALTILVIYIIIGAVGYSIWETWNFFESFYFVFVSMSTIGLGDLVPDHPMFMMASILYLVFGLALTSMCINVVQLKLSDTFKQASAKLGATIGLKVAEEDGSLVPVTPPPIEIPPIHKGKSDQEENNVKDDAKNR